MKNRIVILAVRALFCWVLPRIQICLFLLALPLSLWGEVDLSALMKSYVGSWSGQFTVHSTATGFTEAFEVEQQYWIDEGKLYGVSVMVRDNLMESSNSITALEKDHFYSIVKRGEIEESYIGVPKEGGILWLPRNMSRAKDYQIREWVEVGEGKRLLKTEGFDTYVYSEGLAHLVYKGVLTEVESD